MLISETLFSWEIIEKLKLWLYVFILDTLVNDYNYIEKRVQITSWAFIYFKSQKYICTFTYFFVKELNKDNWSCVLQRRLILVNHITCLTSSRSHVCPLSLPAPDILDCNTEIFLDHFISLRYFQVKIKTKLKSVQQ